ncbi:MAG: thrombospondin type 3 repeat-containing protein [Candidatus Omnitrophica bacterium]|nr:thrombospondin type 3 repeat-containing protein [Candidatus Omnitrophota bacterium]
MKKKIVFLGVFALVLSAICISTSFAAMPDANNVKQVHEGATVGCTVCHPEGNFKELNSYGNAYNDAGRSVDAVKAIDGADSDEDGVSNYDEIKAGTNPGDAESN